MNQHVIPSGTRNRGQCKCVWCGEHRTVECPITDGIKGALLAYAEMHGIQWRSKMRKEWLLEVPQEKELKMVRNILGPKGLDNVKSVHIKQAARKYTK